jgi:peptide/nickel transport system permease protein
MALRDEELATQAAVQVKRRPLRDFLSRLFREKKLGAVGLIIVLAFLVVGIFAPLIAPHGMYDYNLMHVMEGPSAEFLMGTDQYGRDQVSRIIYGARISMIVGLSAGVLAVGIPIFLGIFSGYWGGKFDLILQRFVDAVQSFPWLFIILGVMSLLGPGMLQVILVLGVFWGITNTRMVRGVVLSTKENVYVQAAIATGCSTWRILFRHILPNIWASVIVLFTVTVGSAIIAEATISFLGFGIPPPQPSWGGMLSLEGRKYMYQAPWLALWPGLCLAIVVYGVNMFGDALRDLLDPRLRGGVGRLGAFDTKLLKKVLKRKEAKAIQQK